MDWRPSRDLVLNGALFIAIIPVLAGIHYLFPDSLQAQLQFDHSEFAIHTLWTSAYVHADNNHLFSNLFGYFMGMVPLWLIFTYQYRQWVLRRVFLIFLTALPILINLSSYSIYQFGFGVTVGDVSGFSGVVSAIFGLLFVSVLKVAYDRRGWAGVIGLGAANLLVVMIHMLIRGSAASLDTIALGLFGALLSLTLLTPPKQVRERRIVPRFTDKGKADSLMVFYGSTVLMYVLPRMFPFDWISDSVNIFGHLAGLVLGIVSGIVVILWLRSDPQSRSQWLESTTP